MAVIARLPVIAHFVAMSEWDDDLPRFWGIGNRPIMRPYAPDRAAEILMMVLGGALLLAIFAMAAYIYIKLGVPEAIWLVAPTLIFPAVFALGAKVARSKRIKAEREVANYEGAFARASDRD